MSLTAVPSLDLSRPGAVAEAVGAANTELAGSADTPSSVAALVAELAEVIADGDADELSAVNPWMWIRVQSAALRAQVALGHPDPERRTRLRIALEQLRFLLSRLADREPIGEERGAVEVARWLDAALGGLSQAEKAALLGVSPRTLQRWLSPSGASRPHGEDERRLRIVARLVNQLRHSLTAPGVLDWFAAPRADLEGAAPAVVLIDPARTEALVLAAAASRGHVAA